MAGRKRTTDHNQIIPTLWGGQISAPLSSENDEGIIIEFGINPQLRQFQLRFSKKPSTLAVVELKKWRWIWHNKDRVWYMPLRGTKLSFLHELWIFTRSTTKICEYYNIQISTDDYMRTFRKMKILQDGSDDVMRKMVTTWIRKEGAPTDPTMGRATG